MCYGRNWCRGPWRPSIEVVCGEAELKLFSLGDRDGNFLDLKEDSLVCCIGDCVGTGVCTVRAAVGLVYIHTPFLVRWLAISLDRIVHVGGNLVEEGDSAGGICHEKLVLHGQSCCIRGICLPAAFLMPSRMSGRVWKTKPSFWVSSLAPMMDPIPGRGGWTAWWKLEMLLCVKDVSLLLVMDTG